jgi:hypothetical protein
MSAGGQEETIEDASGSGHSSAFPDGRVCFLAGVVRNGNSGC